MRLAERTYWAKAVSRAVQDGVIHAGDALDRIRKLSDNNGDNEDMCVAYRLEIIRLRDRLERRATIRHTRSSAAKMFRLRAAVDHYEVSA